MNIKHYSTKEAYDYLMQTALDGRDELISKYCVLAVNEMRNAETPASTSKHHVYRGGLLVHTAEVVNYAMNLGFFCEEDDFEALSYAAILHDHRKVADYEWASPASPELAGKWVKTEHGKQIYHISDGYAKFYAAMVNHPNKELVNKIYHCILSHHGRPEWGSPIEPQTHIAGILHMADHWSAFGGPGKIKPNA